MNGIPFESSGGSLSISARNNVLAHLPWSEFQRVLVLRWLFPVGSKPWFLHRYNPFPWLRDILRRWPYLHECIPSRWLLLCYLRQDCFAHPSRFGARNPSHFRILLEYRHSFVFCHAIRWQKPNAVPNGVQNNYVKRDPQHSP